MPLVLHPSSHCDVCLDSWLPPQNPPYAIACGNIFCQRCVRCCCKYSIQLGSPKSSDSQPLRPFRCLSSLESRNCPLCRKTFSIDRLKKLHVDLPESSDTQAVRDDTPVNHALELLKRVALVSGENASTEEFVAVVEEAKEFLGSHVDDVISVRKHRSASISPLITVPVRASSRRR